jgi:DNA-binding beta-propeller fold protein YncE
MVPRVCARDGTRKTQAPIGRLAGAFALAVGLLLTAAAPPASAIPGRIFQLNGPYGCVSNSGAEGCATGRALRAASAAAVSPGGRNVYVASTRSSSLTAFLRDPRNGKVVQLTGARGCVSETGRGRCAKGRGLFGAFSAIVSPDGRNVYVASVDAVAAFARNPATGALTQLKGPAACLGELGSDGCTPARGIGSGHGASVAVSPDGRFVYVASVDSSAVAAFARDPSTGALTQLAGANGCISEGGAEGCSTGRGLAGAFSLALSPSGGEVYVSSCGSCGPLATYSAVAVLPRDSTTGALRQLPGTHGCLSRGAIDGCASTRGLANPNGIAVSPDGDNVYVAASGSSAIVAFTRFADGSLGQRSGTEACVSQGGREGCRAGRALAGAFGVAVSPDGRDVYAVSLNALVGFVRDRHTGTLDPLKGPDGCVSEGGVEGCSTGRGLVGASSVVFAPSGANAYVTAYASNALGTFARNPSRGRVTVHMHGMPRSCAARPFRVRVRVNSLLPLRRVRVFLDGEQVKQVGSSRQPRLIVTIRPRALRAGAHRLRVRAVDVSGAGDARAARFRVCKGRPRRGR